MRAASAAPRSPCARARGLGTKELQQTVDRVERALARGPWIVGESFSLVECCLTPLIDRMDDLGMNALWG